MDRGSAWSAQKSSSTAVPPGASSPTTASTSSFASCASTKSRSNGASVGSVSRQAPARTVTFGSSAKRSRAAARERGIELGGEERHLRRQGRDDPGGADAGARADLAPRGRSHAAPRARGGGRRPRAAGLREAESLGEGERRARRAAASPSAPAHGGRSRRRRSRGHARVVGSGAGAVPPSRSAARRRR